MAYRAENLANSLFPDREDIPKGNDFANMERRKRYIQGYHQAEKDILFNNEKYHTVQVSILDELYDIKKKYEAEKDLALTWEDVRKLILINERMATQAEWKYVPIEQFYTEVLKRFLESRKV